MLNILAKYCNIYQNKFFTFVILRGSMLNSCNLEDSNTFLHIVVSAIIPQNGGFYCDLKKFS